MKNYEAWDIENNFSIYNGGHINSLINELMDYIEYQNHIDEELISEEEIRNLDSKALKKVGIKIFVNA
ncbi:Uncharacterised protein [Niallia circulans]|nr:hypothetical protein [Niallia circulans]MDR4315042.1 hypothetical protein [Niallia circulans]MED3839773.1 hypothetical protein [Niallia circulans]MED4241259.1 hypothetical protein [Niallia circulans]MED4247920.1 hypothetical protein [Niallia circulans]QKH61601.1 hypothetical protein FOC77_13565 [Niallia circulans]